MRNFITLIVVFSSLSLSAQDSKLLGKWVLVSYQNHNDLIDEERDQAELDKKDIKWSLIFKNNGVVIQMLKNMPSKESIQEGTWSAKRKNLELNFINNDKSIKVSYSYKISKNKLILKKQDKAIHATLIAKFGKMAQGPRGY